MKEECFCWGGGGSRENVARKTHQVCGSGEEAQVDGRWLSVGRVP